MTNMEERLLRELLFDTYKTLVPEHSRLGEMLIRKLAAGMYERGARIVIGGNRPRKAHRVHLSVDAKDRITWTGKLFHPWLGYKPHSLIGKHIDTILSDGTAAYRREYALPELLRTGRVDDVPATFVSEQGDLLVGTASSEMLRDSSGAFLRTFTRVVTYLDLDTLESTG